VKIIRGPELWPFHSEREMAACFKVSDKTVNRIRRGDRWKHVPDLESALENSNRPVSPSE